MTTNTKTLINTDYLSLLDKSYQDIKENLGDPAITRLEYLADNIFEFTTYENTYSTMFTRRALDVCEAITNKTTLDYIGDEDNEMWYYLMVNIPFFVNKINWGTSIRGAFWDLDESGFYKEGKQFRGMFFSSMDDWDKFIVAIIKFSHKKD